MSLPFTRDQFLEVFRSYNEAIGLAPLLLMAVAGTAVALAYSERFWRHRIIAALLAVLWLWSGLVYHFQFFSAINSGARLFGALFVVQAVVLVVFGTVQGRWQFEPRRAPTAVLGWVLIIYALAAYPLLGWLLGHGYPTGPSFGAPCPLTVFFLGIMLWSRGGVPIAAVTIPVLWSVVGTSAAVTLGIYEDFALAVSAVIVLATIVRGRVAAQRLTPVLKRT